MLEPVAVFGFSVLVLLLDHRGGGGTTTENFRSGISKRCLWGEMSAHQKAEAEQLFCSRNFQPMRKLNSLARGGSIYTTVLTRAIISSQTLEQNLRSTETKQISFL